MRKQTKNIKVMKFYVLCTIILIVITLGILCLIEINEETSLNKQNSKSDITIFENNNYNKIQSNLNNLKEENSQRITYYQINNNEVTSQIIEFDTSETNNVLEQISAAKVKSKEETAKARSTHAQIVKEYENEKKKVLYHE